MNFAKSGMLFPRCLEMFLGRIYSRFRYVVAWILHLGILEAKF